MMSGVRFISGIKHAAMSAGSLAGKPVALLCLGFILLGAHPAYAQEPLNFFKNYFITGDYVAKGTSLWRKGVNGTASGNIVISGVPEDDVDVVAAFLYVQTAENQRWSGIDHAKFNGFDLGAGNSSMAKALNWDSVTPPCWSFLWGGTRRMVTYRADVMRFLAVKPNGKFRLNTSHTIRVPDSGHFYRYDDDDDEDDKEMPGEIGPRAFGASLVIIYRDPTQPLKAIVIYDGGFTKRAFATMVQNIQGFYEASTTTKPVAKITSIVGDGSRGLSERMLLNDQLVAVNPFQGAEGRKWDTKTIDLTTLPYGAASAKVTVDRHGLFSDCVSFSAMIFSTTVQDTDGDGLLDRWESSASTIYDPNGQPLPNLHAMGADPHVKDLFVEIGYMNAANAMYGGVPKPAHTHLPTETALNMVGEAFKNAPVANPNLSTGIKIHFDVGNNHQNSPYVIPAGLARGGEAIPETACNAADPACQYPSYPGTVGWKTGYRFLRDEILAGPPAPLPDKTTRVTRRAACARDDSIATARTCSATRCSLTRWVCPRNPVRTLMAARTPSVRRPTPLSRSRGRIQASPTSPAATSW